MQCFGINIYSITYIQVTEARKTILLSNIFQKKKCMFFFIREKLLPKLGTFIANSYCVLLYLVSK